MSNLAMVLLLLAAMTLFYVAIGMENKKDRFRGLSWMVEIRGVEPLTFSMPLAYREQVK